MKVDVKTLNNDNIEAMGKTTKMKLSKNAEAQIFNMFTKNVYSDPIGTVIREITSNCFDSHVEAGVDSPVIVRLTTGEDTNYISFIDKGVGMSPDRVENIYGTYFESTKRKTNNEIGGFGIGGKTPLAYTNAFFVITRFEGVEYIYNIFLGNDSPVIELISQESTDKGNGTEVKVPVKTSDLYEFQVKTKRQLFYFENVVFEGFDNDIVQNDYQIIKGDTFLYRGDDYSNTMHVCYGRVAYPIDFNALGLNEYDHRVPVAVNIAIGELEGTGVTVSRESLDYSEENKRILKRKIKETTNELVTLLGKQHDNVQSIYEYYKAMANVKNLNMPNGETISLSSLDFELEAGHFKNFKFKNLPHIPSAHNVLSLMTNIKMYGKKGKRSYRRKLWDQTLNAITQFDNIFFSKDVEFKRNIKKQRYFRTFGSNGDQFWLVTPMDLNDEILMNKLLVTFRAQEHGVNAGGYKTLVSNIDEVKSLIKEFQSDIFGILADHCHEYETTEISQDWLDAQKRQQGISIADGKKEINVRDVNGYGNDKVTLKQLSNFKGRVYYGFRDDEYTLSRANDIFKSLVNNTEKAIAKARSIGNNWGGSYAYGTMFIQISKQNEKYMKMLGHKKALHVDYFYKTFVMRKIDNVLNSRFATIANEKLSSLSDLRRNSEIFEEVAPDIMFKYYDIKDRVELIAGDAPTMTDWTFDIIKAQLPELDLENKMPKINFEKELVELQKVNDKIQKALRFINIPYSFDKERDGLVIDLIKFAMKKVK